MISLKKGDTGLLIDTLGAEIKSLIKNGKEYMWNADPQIWGETAPILFPFVGRAKNGEYRHNGKTYKMPLHGFAGRKCFEIIEQDEEHAVLKTEADSETKVMYPFDFELRQAFFLTGCGVKVEWTVRNKGEDDMYFSIGAHPGFLCRLQDGGNAVAFFDRTGKRLTSYENSLVEGGMFSGRTARVEIPDGLQHITEHTFDNDALVLENGQASRAALIAPDGSEYVSVSFDAPAVGIWSVPGNKGNFVCIEPWYGRGDCTGFNGTLAERAMIQRLPAGGTFKAGYTIEVK